MNKRNFRKLFAVIISVLLTNTLTVFAGTKSVGKISLPEYQQTSYSISINNNISNEEKEKLLKKYFNKKEQTASNFNKAKTQLKKDGYNIVQDTKNPDAWIVSKKIKGKTICLTVYPFDETGKSTINVKDIKNIFKTYKDLTEAGYTVNCSGKTDLYYYFSLGKGQEYTQITANNWTISKGKTKVKISFFDNKGKTISLSKVKEAFKFEDAKKQLKKDGYTIVQDSKNPDAWIVSKKINGKLICFTVYPFDKNGKSTINVENIKNIFKTYKDLIKAGYTVKCSEKTDLHYYSSLGKEGKKYIQITANEWTISKGKTKVKIPCFDNNGKTISLSKVNETFKFEKAKAQLKKDGFKIVQDSKNPDAWIVSKKIKGKTICLTVYPFDETGKSTINVKDIKNIFKTYKDLIKAGYTVKCSEKTDLHYYSSLGKEGKKYIQITTNNWMISKGQSKVKVPYFDVDGKELSLSKVKNAFNFEKTKTQLKKDGYTIVQDSKNPDVWIVGKETKEKTICLTVYPLKDNKETTINKKYIKTIFDTYTNLTEEGYTVNCSKKKDLYYYSSLGEKGQNFEQITTGKWTLNRTAENGDKCRTTLNPPFEVLNSEDKIKNFVELINSLIKQRIYDYDEGEKIHLTNIDTEDNNLTLKVLFSDELTRFCEQNKMFSDSNILKKYNLAISVGRKIDEVMGENLQYLSEKQFKEILKTTLNYYGKVFEIASSTDILNNDVSVYGLYNSEEKYGGQRFSPGGLNSILEILNIEPATFDSIELYTIPSNQYQQEVEKFLNKIVNFNTSGNQKALFYFDGHGSENGFYYDGSEYVSVKNLTKKLIQAYNNGVNLENLTLLFGSCKSYYYIYNIIDKLKSKGIDNFPQFVTVAGKETKFGYTNIYYSYTDNNDYKTYHLTDAKSNLEEAIINYLKELKKENPKELENLSGHLTMELIANCPMYMSNHTILITNSQIEKLNEQYAQKIGTIVGRSNVNYAHNPYSELQTEHTVEALENIANFFNLKNPEEFKNSSIGTAIGVIMETFSFMQSSDTDENPSFENQHKNLTSESKSVIQKIRDLCSETAKVVTNTIGAALAKPAAILTEWITHFIYNKAVISKNGANTTTNSLSVGEISSILSENVNGETKSIFEQISNLFKVPVEKMTNVVANFIYNNSVISETKQDTMMSSLKNTVFSFLKNIGTELKKVIEPTVDKFFQFLQDRNIL